MENPAKEIEHVVSILLSGSIKERQKVMNDVFTADVVFDHPLVQLRGRRELFDLYQFWHEANVKISFKLPKIVVSQDKDRVVLDVDEYIQPFFFPFFRPLIRLVVILDLQRTPSGYKICRQEDHILWSESLLGLLPPVRSFWREYITRLSGLSIVYALRGASAAVSFLSTNLLCHLPQSSAISQKIKEARQSVNPKLMRQWQAEEDRLKN